MRSVARGCVTIALLAAFGLMGAAPSVADVTGPTVSLSSSEANPGDQLLVSLSGFNSSQVTIAVCGNLAKRGSADCAMASSQGAAIDKNRQITVARLEVQPPPMPCPCIVRVLSARSDEFGVAPIKVIGHPEAPVTDAASGPLVDVKIAATRHSGGALDALRSALGGRTTYRITVTARNLTTEPLSTVELTAAAGGWLSDQLASLALEPPGPIGPGQTYTTTRDVDLGAPLVGHVNWKVTASGAGPSVTVATSMSAAPWLLYFLSLVFVVDIALFAWRRLRRRQSKRGGAAVEDPERRAVVRTGVGPRSTAGAV